MKSSAESENRVLSLRRKAGLTQKELAERANTSQQQVARIERGVQRASLQLAIRLCKALDEPLQKVFPLSRKAVHAMSKMDKRSFGDDLLNGGDLTNLMADAGIDLDSRLWFIKLRFTNGVVRTFEVSASEQLRMRDSMFGSSQFFVFDSGDARLAINLHHVEYSHWLFEGPSTLVVNSAGANDSETARVGPDPSDAVIVMLGSNAEPLLFRVEADVPEDPKEEGGMGQMENLLYTAEQLEEEDERRFHFEDEDGEEVFLLRSAVSLISIPLWVIEPSLVEARREGFDEDTAAAV